MKLAIQIFGHLRSYKQTAESVYSHIISKYDTDVYIHIWDTDGFKINDGGPIGDTDVGVTGNKIDVDNISSYYSHKCTIVMEPYTDDVHNTFIQKAQFLLDLKSKWLPTWPSYANLHRPVANFSQWYKWYSVNKLRIDSGKQYDFVINLRPDILINNDLVMPDIIDDVIYMTEPWLSAYGNSDSVVMGSEFGMNIWNGLYNYSDINGTGRQPTNSIGSHNLIAPHMIYDQYLADNNLRKTGVDLSCTVIRG